MPVAMAVIFAFTTAVSSFVQLENALSPILVTEEGIVMLVSTLQYVNAEEPIVSRFSGSFISSRYPQL